MLCLLHHGWTRIRSRRDSGRVAQMIRAITFAGTLVAVAAATGCGETRPRPAPNVTGQRLDAAEDTLDAEGLRYRTIGGGAFGIVVRSHWLVCRQRPAAPTRTTNVTLVVGRSCPVTKRGRVPDVIGENLKDARVLLQQSGFHVDVESVDGDPILVESLWIVCDQWPEGGKRATNVELDAADDWDDCDAYESW